MLMSVLSNSLILHTHRQCAVPLVSDFILRSISASQQRRGVCEVAEAILRIRFSPTLCSNPAGR